jgi:hypothetical protein
MKKYGWVQDADGGGATYTRNPRFPSVLKKWCDTISLIIPVKQGSNVVTQIVVVRASNPVTARNKIIRAYKQLGVDVAKKLVKPERFTTIKTS